MADDDALTIRQFLGELESEELLRLDDELRELDSHPAFVRVRELVKRHRVSVERRTAKQLLDGAPPAATLDTLMQRESLRAFNAGQLRGMEQFEGLIGAVSKLATEVRNALGVRPE